MNPIIFNITMISINIGSFYICYKNPEIFIENKKYYGFI